MKKTVLLFTLLFLGGFLKAQVSYDEFKKSYTPTYEKLVPDAKIVKTLNDNIAATLGAALEILVDQNDEDAKLNVSAILTSCKRNLVAEGLKLMSAEKAIIAVGWMKESWQREVMWFVDMNTYHNLAPHLSGLKYWTPDNTPPLFAKEVSNFGLLYGAAGPDFATSSLKGLNSYITNYWTGPNGESPSGPVNDISGFKGAMLSAGIKLSDRLFLDVGYQFRTTKTMVEGSNYIRDIKYTNNTISTNFIFHKGGGFFSWGHGPGLQMNLGAVSEKNDVNTSNWTKAMSGFNAGINYGMGIYFNPEKLPVMLAVRPYWQMNLMQIDFNKISGTTPVPDIEDNRSGIGSLGLGIQLAYKFGKEREKENFINFNDELANNSSKKVNTVYSEITPRISPDGRTLYFVRADHPYNTEGSRSSQDIWVADVSNGVPNAEAKHLTSPFNQRAYNSVVGVSPDENTLLIKGNYENGEYVGKGYSFVYRTKTGWSKPEGLDIEGYADMTKGTYVGGYWSQDGKHLVLSLSENSNSDLQDLYHSYLKEDGTWSKPKSLGSVINDKATGEHSPYLASDGKTLYYSSNRDGGEGSYDIWFTKRLDDTWTNWSEPKNLGSDVNTDGWDAYYSIDASGKYAYMVSGKNSIGREDIIRIKLKEDVQPDPVVLVRGKVLNAKTKEPLDAKIAYNGLVDGKNYGIASTNPANGEYKIVLPYGKNYDFSANASGYIGISDNLDLTGVGEYREIERDLYLVPIEVGSTVRLNNIFFETGKAELKAESYFELDRVVKVLTDNPNMTIEISGHTDNVGDKGFNKTLSQKRADAVVAYLLSKGVDKSRLVSKGYGMEKPVSDNDSEEGRAQNRRVEFTILKTE